MSEMIRRDDEGATFFDGLVFFVLLMLALPWMFKLFGYLCDLYGVYFKWVQP